MPATVLGAEDIWNTCFQDSHSTHFQHIFSQSSGQVGTKMIPAHLAKAANLIQNLISLKSNSKC